MRLCVGVIVCPLACADRHVVVCWGSGWGWGGVGWRLVQWGDGGGGRGGVSGTREVEVVAVRMTVVPRLMNCYAGGGGRRGAGGGDGAGAQRHHDTHRRKSRHTRTRTCAHAQMHTCTCTRSFACTRTHMHTHHDSSRHTIKCTHRHVSLEAGARCRAAVCSGGDGVCACVCVCVSNTCFLTRSRRPTPYVVPHSASARRATSAVTAARRGYAQPSA